MRSAPMNCVCFFRQPWHQHVSLRPPCDTDPRPPHKAAPIQRSATPAAPKPGREARRRRPDNALELTRRIFLQLFPAPSPRWSRGQGFPGAGACSVWGSFGMVFFGRPRWSLASMLGLIVQPRPRRDSVGLHALGSWGGSGPPQPARRRLTPRRTLPAKKYTRMPRHIIGGMADRHRPSKAGQR